MNYYWQANGSLKHVRMTEFFKTQDDKICLGETCLTKDEIITIKKHLLNYDIMEHSKSLDSLEDNEIKEYIKDIFEKILQNKENNSELDKIFNKYFTYSMFNPRTGGQIRMSDFYKLKENEEFKYFDYQDLFINIEKLTVHKLNFDEDKIKEIISSNKYYATKNIIMILSNSKIIDVVSRWYYIQYGNIQIALMKITTNNEKKWVLSLTTQDLLKTIKNKQNDNFNNKFRSNIMLIESINGKLDISLTQYREYIDNIRFMSIYEGTFSLDIFKNNIFISYYKKDLDLSKLTNDDMMNILYNPELFEEKTFYNIMEEKVNLGYHSVNKKYYLLRDNTREEIRLIYGQKNITDKPKWKILYLEVE